MSIHGFQTKLGQVRYARYEDCTAILSITNKSMANTFRIFSYSDLCNLLDSSVLCICQLNIQGEVIGFLALKDYPPVLSVIPSAWEEYIWAKYKTIDLNARNTLFIHLISFHILNARIIVDNMLRSVFMHDPYLKFLVMFKNDINYPLLIPGQTRPEGCFKRIVTTDKGVQAENLPAICIADRSEVTYNLKLRRAVEEDNDDIVPILEKHAPRLKEMYGEFYISELVAQHHDSERVLLVCEHNEVAIGVMCLNTQINYKLLEENFELSPFAGLRKLKNKPEYTTFVDYEQSDTGYHGTSAAPTREDPAHYQNNDQDQNQEQDQDEEQEQYNNVSNVTTETSYSNSNVYNQPSHLSNLNLLESDDSDEQIDIIDIELYLMDAPRLLSYDAAAADRLYPLIVKSDSIDAGTDHTIKIPKSQKTQKVDEQTMNSFKIWVPPETVGYKGEPNAFLLELYAIHEDYDDRYGFEMLTAAYDFFPDLSYCIMTLPSHHSVFPLLDYFTYVTPYSLLVHMTNQVLYVAHVNTIKGKFRVRHAEVCDIPKVHDLLENTRRSDFLKKLFETSLSSLTLEPFVILNENVPVGVMVVGPLDNSQSIRVHYLTKSDVNGQSIDAGIYLGVLSPVFERHSRWFMREILRLTKYTSLFWICRLQAKGDAHPSRNLMSLANYMAPVRARELNLKGFEEMQNIYTSVTTPFALWHLDKSLAYLPKVDVNDSILVIGDSNTGLSFLETLLFGPSSRYLNFTNITLVSENGLPCFAENLRAADICVPRISRYIDKYLKKVPFYFYLDIMVGVVIKIDRKEKCVYMSNGLVKYYDYLVLTCGTQYQAPDYMREQFDKIDHNKDKPCTRMLMDNPKYHPDHLMVPGELPENVMIISNVHGANICMRKLMKMMSTYKDTPYSLRPDNTVVVYGQCIEAYCTVAALLELGLAPNLITYVEPFPPEDSKELRINCFNDEIIDERVQTNLETLGIQLYRYCRLVSWSMTDRRATSLRMVAHFEAFRIPIFAAFVYGRRALKTNMIKAMCESGLVYDGGLVVNERFETNDPKIYGAGWFTCYSRSLYARKYSHKYHQPGEIGAKLASSFLAKLDPFKNRGGSFATSFQTDCDSNGLDGWTQVPVFYQPVGFMAVLPGPLYYFNYGLPGPIVPAEIAQNPSLGHTLQTDKNGNFFRLRLNNFHCVERITCLSKEMINADNLLQLFRKHEKFLHNLLARYEMGLIDDLFAYFKQRWMIAIYQECIHDIVSDITEHEFGTVYDLVKSKINLPDEKSWFPKSKMVLQDEHDSEEDTGHDQLGTIHAIIEKYVTTKCYLDNAETNLGHESLRRCGYSEGVRNEAIAFWTAIGGERLVNAFLKRHLQRNEITHPVYANILSYNTKVGHIDD